MYKILLADDEGIVTESISFIIQNKTDIACQIEVAKSGRSAIETAEWFHPDIVFMDIQMPGLNGIEAMQEIKARNGNVVFIVLSAYDQFNYAQAAIDIGVLDYITKPSTSVRIIEVLNKAIAQIEEKRKKISSTLEIKEKLNTVIPMLESSFVHSILFQNSQEDIKNYLQLLEIEEHYGYVMVLGFGENIREGNLTNPIGSSVKMYKIFEDIRKRFKDFNNIISGNPLSNRIILFKASEKDCLSYEETVHMVDNMRSLLREFEKKYNMSFKLGIGSVVPIMEIGSSYQEALEAVRVKTSKIVYYGDIPAGYKQEDDFPIEIEKNIYRCVENGNADMARKSAVQFYEWMIHSSGREETDIRTKALEFVLQAERIAHEKVENVYHFAGSDYMQQALELEITMELKNWYAEKIYKAAQQVSECEEQSSEIVTKAKAYMEHHFNKNISLEDVAGEVNISPYYFSKIFKNETGENYIDYLTMLRMEYAEKMVREKKYSIKEICVRAGYNNPNYFSRVFKKYTGFTPSEYKEGISE